MEALALLIAGAGSLLVLCLRPVAGLAVYTIISMWYPYGIATVKVGTVDFSAGRIVILVLFLKIFFGTKLAERFKIIWLDRFVVVLFVAEVVAGLTTIPPMEMIENRFGDFFDMALPYFAVRLIIIDKEKIIVLLKAICWSTAILAIFAFYESMTGDNLLKLGRFIKDQGMRMTFFHRSQLTFRHPIYYGVFSAMTGVLCMGLSRIIGGGKKLYKVLLVLCFLGAFSSMSSGAMLTMLGSVAFLFFYKYRQNWKQALIIIVILCGVVELISNRHFYDVIDRFCFNAQTAWYRARLFEVAFFEGGMSGHWLCGYGFEDPLWCVKIDGRNHTDMVNHYLLELCRFGLVGFVPFCAVIVAAFKKLFEGFCHIPNDGDRWMVWCVAASLIGVLLAVNSVSLFGMPMTMLFIVFGFCGSMSMITGGNNLCV